MEFYDFIGNELTLNCFCAYPGGGNAKAEYGTLLYKVTGFDEVKSKVKVVRLYVDWAQTFESGNTNIMDGFHPSHLKNSIVSSQIVPDHYNRNNKNSIKLMGVVRYANSTIENTNKLAIVYPSDQVKNIFEKVLNSDTSVFEDMSIEKIGSWIDGIEKNIFTKS